MNKKTIMAVCAVFLVAVLFAGAASAADVTNEGDFANITANVSSIVAATGIQSQDIKIYNTSVLTDASNLGVYVNWGDDTSVVPLTLTGGTPEYNITSQHTYKKAGSYAITLYNASTVTSTTLSKQLATVTVVDARTIADGKDAFVYEHIYVAGAVDNKLTKYTDGQNPTAVNQISGTNGVFYLTEAVVNNQYGAYYYANAPASGVTTFIYIWYPELTLQAELTTNTATNAVAGDSIDGKTINKNTNVTFMINSPKVAPAIAAASAKVVFTTPVGGKTTDFGGIPFAGLTFGGQTQLKAPFAQPGDKAAAGTWTAQAEYTFAPFNDYAKKSNTISFTVQSTSLTLTAAKDSVVRSNPFTVTIQGDSNMLYFVYLDAASASDNNPTLQPGQSGMKSFAVIPTVNGVALPVVGTATGQTWAYFSTDASGQRTIQYNTAADTTDKTYTVKVYQTKLSGDISAVPNPLSITGNDYDSTKVKVEKGAVTVTASGDGSYYIGQEIKLTGTNTDSSYIYLFMTGPNLDNNGIVLKDIPGKNPAYNATSPVAVKTDNTWEYKWDTTNCGLDTGAYTIYATSVLTNGKSSTIQTFTASGQPAVKLSDSEYATVSVNLKRPFLQANPSSSVVAKGDKIYVRGTAEGDPKNLKLYIFGPNKFFTDSITVNSDGSYEKKLEIGSEWASNQYYVVVEHPMYNNKIDVYLNVTGGSFTGGDATGFNGQIIMYIPKDTASDTTFTNAQASFIVWGSNKLQGSNAADALTKMIDSANIDDIYTKLTFTVQEPWIKIVNPGDQASGSKFTIKGTTNLAVDDQILVEVMSSSFMATDKTATDITSGTSQTTKVVAGENGDNSWSIEVDTTNWKLDQYTIKAQGIEADVTTTTDFNLVEKIVTTVPTTTTTTTTTTTAPVTTTATPTTPGFGAFIALAGLGAVALLVLRRN